jgi:hypothetical protein
VVKALFLFQPLKRLIIGFSPRLLGHSKVDQIRIPRASHSKQSKENAELHRCLWLWLGVASEPRVSRQFAPNATNITEFPVLDAIIFLLAAFLQTKRPTNVFAARHFVFPEARSNASSCHAL